MDERGRGESLRERGSTPRMRRQLRVIAVLAGFVVLIVVIAFAGALFRPEGEPVRASFVPVVQPAAGADFQSWRVPANVVIDGEEQPRLDLFTVRAGPGLQVLWARSTHLGCRTQPVAEVPEISVPPEAVFVDPCGGSSFGLDGRCLDGPCPRGLDGFAVVERGGEVYVDLDRVVRGAPRER